MVEKKKIVVTAPLIIGIVILAAAVIALGFAFATHYHLFSWTIEQPSTTFDLYVDSVLTPDGEPITIPETLFPGDTKTIPTRVVNTGNVPIKMSMVVTGLPTGYTLNWATDGTVIAVGAESEGDLTLTVPDPETSGPKNCNIEITATEES